MVFSEIFIVHHHFADFRIKDQQNKDHVANTLFSLVHLNFKLFSENQAGLYLVVGGGGGEQLSPQRFDKATITPL